MKFISVRDLRTYPAQIWKQLQDELEMVITNNGKPIALLTPLNDINLEETLLAIRSAKAINAIKLMQQKSIALKNNQLTDKIIEHEISSTRKRK